MLNEVELQSPELQLDAAFVYYVAGYYARAAHLLQAEAFAFEAMSVQHWLWLFLAKRLQELQAVVSSACSSDLLSDSVIADNLRSGAFVDQLSRDGTVEEEVVERVLSKAVAECVKCVLEFAQDGLAVPLGYLDDRLGMCEQLALKVGDPRWWWRIISVRYMFREFVENSLWTRLRLMQGETDGDKIVRPYVAANYGPAILLSSFGALKWNPLSLSMMQSGEAFAFGCPQAPARRGLPNSLSYGFCWITERSLRLNASTSHLSVRLLERWSPGLNRLRQYRESTCRDSMEGTSLTRWTSLKHDKREFSC